MRQDILAVVILLAVIVLYATEKIPLVMTAILSMLAMFFTGILSFQDAFCGFSNNATMMVLGLSIMSLGLSETGVVDLLGKWLTRVFTKNNFSERAFILLGCLITAGLCMFVGPVLIVAIFMSIIDSVASQPGARITRRNTTLPISMAATCGANMTNISSTTVILSSGLLAESSFGRGFTFFEPAAIGLPALLCILLFYSTFGYRYSAKVFNFDDSLKEAAQMAGEEKVYSKKKYMTAIVIMAVTIAFLIFSDFTLGAVTFAGAALMIMTGCISVDKAFKETNWPLVLLVAASIGFAKGIDVSGAGLLIANFLIKLGGPLASSGIGICIIGLVCASLLSNVMSNSSTALILIPIFSVMAEKVGVPLLPVAIACGCGAGLAMATPICTTNITQTTVVGYRFADYLKVGGILNLMYICACAATIYFLYFV